MKDATKYLYQWLEIDKSQLLRNIQLLRSTIKDDIAAVVKGNAYGHDMIKASRIFREAGMKRFCTYHPKNAIRLKKEFPDLQVMALGPVQLDEIKTVFEAGVELFVWDTPFINHLIRESSSFDNQVNIHLEVETGMYRTGLPMEKVPELLHKVEDAAHLNVKGICTHFSGADEIDNQDRIQEQFNNWKKLREIVRDTDHKEYEWHGTNTSASLYLKNELFSYSRIGLLLYGFFPSVNAKNAWPKNVEKPAPALTFKSRVCGTNEIPKGRYSGYGMSWEAPEQTNLYILPVGYSDGLSRNLSNKWKVKVGDDHYQTIGRINMNLTVFAGKEDLPKQQTEVCLISPQPPYDWYAACRTADQYLYEFLSTLPPHIPRIIV